MFFDRPGSMRILEEAKKTQKPLHVKFNDAIECDMIVKSYTGDCMNVQFIRNGKVDPHWGFEKLDDVVDACFLW